MCLFSIATVTNCHKFSYLKQHNFVFKNNPVRQKFRLALLVSCSGFYKLFLAGFSLQGSRKNLLLISFRLLAGFSSLQL